MFLAQVLSKPSAVLTVNRYREKSAAQWDFCAHPSFFGVFQTSMAGLFRTPQWTGTSRQLASGERPEEGCISESHLWAELSLKSQLWAGLTYTVLGA